MFCIDCKRLMFFNPFRSFARISLQFCVLTSINTPSKNSIQAIYLEKKKQNQAKIASNQRSHLFNTFWISFHQFVSQFTLQIVPFYYLHKKFFDRSFFPCAINEKQEHWFNVLPTRNKETIWIKPVEKLPTFNC